MLATGSSRTVLWTEGALATMTVPSRGPVLRLADGELDRAYRLAGLILGDQHEAQNAVQDALLRAYDVLAAPKASLTARLRAR